MLAVFCSPSRYTQGKNATAALGEEMTKLGLRGPALIVAGSNAVRLLAEVWQKYLGEAHIAHAVHRFGGECSLAEIERIKNAAREHGSRVIIGQRCPHPITPVPPHSRVYVL
ncbi:MAG: iron-containing alcohol dehydrogenase [Deltaproteobacteria bacterium]|nr:iron-containing alcohol dehydrogenase [Deltaproteobacteria bacterium]